MSQRSRKAKREAKLTPVAEPSKAKEPRRRNRWRVTLILGVVGLTMLALSLIGGLQPPMLTLYNKTGGTLNDIRVSFPGGEGKAAPVPDGDKTTLVLRPIAGAAAPAGPHFLRLEVGMPDGSRFLLRSFVLAKDKGAHEVFFARPQAKGGFELVHQGSGGTRLSLRDLLRGIGIRF